MQFAGASLGFWLSFHAVVAVLLLVDLLILGRAKEASRQSGVRRAWAWTAVLAAVAFLFAISVSKQQGHQRAIEFVSGYLVEGSLSIDNLFVFLLLFRSLRLTVEDQRRVLLWGVLGAIVLRAMCIFAGVALLERFTWVEYVFGAILLYAGIRLLKAKHGDQGDHQQPGPIKWLRRRIDQSDSGVLEGSAFLLLVIAVEATDLLFALDSIPAVLAITRDTFIVYTSNIFAILGLRSLYFGLAGMLDRLRLLHYGLAVILIFVAAKMLLVRWIEVPASISLLVILVILGVFAAASFRPVAHPPRG
ncbi:TerC/Alx family metal homeostasis membrane protein [Acidipila sp. EB88]|nr:TerC/Alx family metal homeostasis membrane protein [Acidipila sp. EB88]